MDINRNLITNKMSVGKIYYWILIIFFILAFGMIWISAFVSGAPNNSTSFFISILFLLSSILFWAFFSPKIQNISSKVFKLWLAVPLLAILVLALISAILFQQDIPNFPLDVGACHFHAQDLAMGVERPAPWNHYFVSYDTNALSMVFLYFAYSISMFFTGAVHPVAGSIMNAIFLCIALYSTVYIGYAIKGRVGAFFIASLSLFFTPYYLMLCIPYTDSLSLPFTSGGLALYLYAIQNKSKIKAFFMLLLSFFVLAIGFLMKGNVLIVLVAVCIHLLLFVVNFKIYQRLLAIVAASVILVSSSFVFKAILQKSLIVDYTAYDNLHIPWSHWVMMGLTNHGGFNMESYEYTGSFETIEEKEEAIKIKINESLNTYRNDLPSFFRWFTEKNKFGWAHGDYYTVTLATLKPIHSIDKSDSHWNLVRNYTQGLHLIFYLNLLVFCFRSIRKKQISSFMLLTLTIFCGMFVFLSVWEANPRYPYNISFLLLLSFVWMLPYWTSFTQGIVKQIKNLIGKQNPKN